MTWNIHKKILLTGLNTAPALDLCAEEPARELPEDPDWAGQERFIAKIPHKKFLALAVGLAILTHLLVFLLGSQIRSTEAPVLSDPSIMTFTFSFVSPEPLAPAASNPSATPPKSIQNPAAQTSLSQTMAKVMKNKKEPEPQPQPLRTAENSEPLSESPSASGFSIITQAAGPEEVPAADQAGGSASLTSLDDASSSAAVYPAAYHSSSATAATPIIKATPNYGVKPILEYPELARHRGYEGLVLLEVLVDRQGKVAEMRVAVSSGYPILDQAALQAVKKVPFNPARKGTETVEDWVKIPIRFQLKEQN
jgi:protein TonB